MKRNSLLSLSTIAVVTLAGVQAGITDCYNSNANCTGYFYEDINAAFVDCHNANGVLINREEQYYTEDLEKECNSTIWGNLSQGMNMTHMNAVESGLNGNASVDYCDYYQRSVGYQFTQVNSGIGLVVLEDRVGSERDLYWKNYTAPTPPVQGQFWSWKELASLIESYSESQCAADNETSESNSTANATVPLPAGDAWKDLNINWAQWNQTAQANQNISSWSKAEWKFWIQSYVQYYNSYQAYVYYFNRADDGSFASSGLALEFSNIWSFIYDFDFVTVELVLLDLQAQSSVVSNCRSWFTEFLGVQGYVYLNTTYSIRIEQTTISTGLVSIVDYIKINIEKEIQMLCPQCNFSFPAIPYTPVVNSTNGTDPGPGTGSGGLPNNTDGGSGNETDNGTDNGNGTVPDDGTPIDNGTNSTNGTDGNNNGTNNGTNSTDNSTNVSFWNSANYSLPSSCSFVNNRTAVRCSSGFMRTVTYTFVQLNAWYQGSSLSNVCSAATTKYDSCKTNAIITDQNTCFRLSFYNSFQMERTQQLYAWLYFDQAARNDVFGRCQASQNSFALTNEQFTAGFQFAFGNLQ